jgi:hypothetical protein
MRKFSLLFLLLAADYSCIANDGSFYALGNTLIPLKESTVQLKKEILSLERRGNWMQVDIYFEFFNPGPEKELTVGFVTPPAVGDVKDEEAEHPQVKDFMVMAGNRILPFKIAKMNESGFKVTDKLADGYDFVYYFTIRFAKGITVIRHSYLYRGGVSVEAMADFDYRLTTGTSWAGGVIGDFELNISMGDNSYFAIPVGFNNISNRLKICHWFFFSYTMKSISGWMEKKRMISRTSGKCSGKNSLILSSIISLTFNCGFTVT